MSSRLPSLLLVMVLAVACGGPTASSEPPSSASEPPADSPAPPSGFTSNPDGEQPAKPTPPRYEDPSITSGGMEACLAREVVNACPVCDGCDTEASAQASLDALIGRCGRLCGDIVIDFDPSGCAVAVYATKEQQSFEENFECVLSALRQERWACAVGTSAWASFGSYCSK